MRSCCELRTSRVVRWPPCASFCTPESATLAARTSASAAVSATLAPSCAAQALMTAVWAWFRMSSSTIRACIASSLACRISGRSEPAVVNRNIGLAQDRGNIVALRAERGVSFPIALDAALHRDVRPEAALGDLGAKLGYVGIVHRRENRGMLLAGDRERLLARARQQPVDRIGCCQSPGGAPMICA